MKHPKFKVGDRVTRTYHQPDSVDTISEVILLPEMVAQNIETGVIDHRPARWVYRVVEGFKQSPRVMFAETILSHAERKDAS